MVDAFSSIYSLNINIIYGFAESAMHSTEYERIAVMYSPNGYVSLCIISFILMP
jgi:hypothetical protein